MFWVGLNSGQRRSAGFPVALPDARRTMSAPTWQRVASLERVQWSRPEPHEATVSEWFHAKHYPPGESQTVFREPRQPRRTPWSSVPALLTLRRQVACNRMWSCRYDSVGKFLPFRGPFGLELG